MVLMIDNYDSFTYNLVQYLGELGEKVVVARNDEIHIDAIKTLAPQHIVISPGPCTPNEAGISMQVVHELAGHIPILGVCLGHQCIGQVYGGQITHAAQIMHGKTSMIYHHNRGLFENLDNPFQATRYHSLSIAPQSLPDCLQVTAWTQTDTKDQEEIMGIEHKTLAVYGVQFHPESLLTMQGHLLLKNFLAQGS